MADKSFFPPETDDDAATPEQWAGLLVLHAEAVHGCEHTAIVREGIGMAGPRGEQRPLFDLDKLALALHEAQCEWMCSRDVDAPDEDEVQHMAPGWWHGEARRIAAAYAIEERRQTA